MRFASLIQELFRDFTPKKQELFRVLYPLKQELFHDFNP